MPGWLDANRNNLSYGAARAVDPTKVRPQQLATSGLAAAARAVPAPPELPSVGPTHGVTSGAARAPALPQLGAGTPAPPAPGPVDPARTATNPGRVQMPAAPAAPEPAQVPWRDRSVFERYVKYPAQQLYNLQSTAEGLGWLASRVPYAARIPGLAPAAAGLTTTGAALSPVAAPAALAAIVGDGAVKAWDRRNDVAGSTARMNASNANWTDSTQNLQNVLGLMGGVPGMAQVRMPLNALGPAVDNASKMLQLNGEPIADFIDASAGLVNDTGRAATQALRGSTLDAALQTRQDSAQRATEHAMAAGAATQQQLRDAAVRARRQQQADIQGRRWRPWLWGM